METTEQPTTNDQHDNGILALLQRLRIDPTEARKALDMAKLKFEAGAMMGVAGFWS